MLCSLVNHNQRLLEENYALNARLEVFAKKLGRKKAKLENERMISRQRKADYEDTSRKLWEKTLDMEKLMSKIKIVYVNSLKRVSYVSWSKLEFPSGGLVGASYLLIASFPFFDGLCSPSGFGRLIPRLKLGIGTSGPHCSASSYGRLSVALASSPDGSLPPDFSCILASMRPYVVWLYQYGESGDSSSNDSMLSKLSFVANEVACLLFIEPLNIVSLNRMANSSSYLSKMESDGNFSFAFMITVYASTFVRISRPNFSFKSMMNSLSHSSLFSVDGGSRLVLALVWFEVCLGPRIITTWNPPSLITSVCLFLN
ncbi:hypothetical protein L6452_34389 [Arctium lappa]|uniref:Uncharacterized protein n=1 Tax=Arctium lappa TaxID=4217 RepID=A0ACB8YHB6_ARCLA|nr:hypothetical protein L6452_34389 [Arctium lappa]